jgi:hypothetical protein
LIISCPECSGKLSTAAAFCPHCGYTQDKAPVPNAPAPAASPAKTALPPPPLPELLLPSDKAVRGAARRVWSEWVHSSVWRFFIGAVILIIAVCLMILVFLVANRMNSDTGKHSRARRSLPELTTPDEAGS